MQWRDRLRGALAADYAVADSDDSAKTSSAECPQEGFGTIGTVGKGAKTAKQPAILAAHGLPDVPATWCEGVARLAALPPPGGVTPACWAALAATSTYLLQSHGAELRRAGWDALDLFGLHRRAPATNPPGWGLAWLLGATGELLDVAPGAVGRRRGPDGARLTFRRSGRAARAGVVPAWMLSGGASHSATERDGTSGRTPTS